MLAYKHFSPHHNSHQSIIINVNIVVVGSVQRALNLLGHPFVEALLITTAVLLIEQRAGNQPGRGQGTQLEPPNHLQLPKCSS